jgi:hypothetical protein
LPVGVVWPAALFAESPILLVPASKTELHVSVDLPQGAAATGSWQLVETAAPDCRLPAQIVPGIATDGSRQAGKSRLVVDIPPAAGAGGPRRFRLAPLGEGPRPAFAFSDDSAASLRIAEANRPVLVYNHGTITCEKAPVKDNRRSRACYIHPLWGIHGEVLTDDFPKDHYHHHGVFWAWPHVEIGDEKHDLWMYKKIAPRFVRWLARDAGPLTAVLGVENGWFVADRKVMIERVWIEVGKATAAGRIVDLDFTWIPVDRSITLRGAEGKSYGGLTIRFAVDREKNSTITVPEGATPKDLPEKPLPWADLTCKFPGAKQASGAAILIPQGHPDYPPTWLTRHYGAMCVGWPGVRGQTFPPDKPIRLRYRLWIHPSTVDVAALSTVYDGYLAEAQARWE